MSTYYVTLITTASHTVKVEAASEEAAIDAAEMEGAPSLCHQCANIDLGDWEFSGNREFDIHKE